MTILDISETFYAVTTGGRSTAAPPDFAATLTSMGTITTVEPDIRAGRSAAYPAGPPFFEQLVRGRLIRAGAIEALRESAATYGDLIRSRIFGRHIYQLNHPALIED